MRARWLSPLLLLGTGCADSSRPDPAAAPRRVLTLVASVDTRRSDNQNGFNGDVWLHEGFAWVGTWGREGSCPGGSIKAVDVRDPAQPRQVASFAEHRGTTTEDVVVRRVATPAFTGNLLATGLQHCGDGGIAGLDLWDVTDPAQPRHLSTFDLGSDVHGVHELDVEVRSDRVLAHVAVPGGEASRWQAGALFLDVTDPRRPVLAGSFGLPRDAGIALRSGEYVHSVRADPSTRRLYLSYWDAGVVILDLADPAAPRLIGRTTFPGGAEGNAHSIALSRGGAILLECDEDFTPASRDGIEAGWGFLRVWDIAVPAAPVALGSFRTAASRASASPPGWWSIHNIEMAGTLGFASWYSDGIRVLDLADPATPREIAFLVPPAAVDPFGVFPTVAMVWGVATDGNLVLASDVNAGLHVLRLESR